MWNYRFDGRVAVITGAGRGIGRAHALLFAERGAKVVVNDLGGTKEGEGRDEGVAHQLVTEIVEAGGVAVADTSDIGTEAGCHALIETAIEEFGRVDVLVNNAGISRWATFPEADAENLERTLDVHLRGSWHATRAAWSHMVRQGFGRVVMTTSTGLFGLPDNLAYATAKGGIIGMMRSLSIAGAPHGITVNCISPNAVTRKGDAKAVNSLTTTLASGARRAPGMMDTEMVSPMVAYLAHESCDVTGEIYLSGGRRFARMFIAATEGYLQPGDDLPTIEDVAAHWAEINDEADYYVPQSLPDWVSRYMAHAQR